MTHRKYTSTASRVGRLCTALGLPPELGRSLVGAEQRRLQLAVVPPILPRRASDEGLVEPARQGIVDAEEPRSRPASRAVERPVLAEQVRRSASGTAACSKASKRRWLSAKSQVSGLAASPSRIREPSGRRGKPDRQFPYASVTPYRRLHASGLASAAERATRYSVNCIDVAAVVPCGLNPGPAARPGCRPGRPPAGSGSAGSPASATAARAAIRSASPRGLTWK